VYADINIPFVDAKVASALCKGGVVEYLVETSSGITDAWILQYVVPNMVRAGMQQQLCSDVRQRVGLRKQELRRLAMEGKYECF
jgi:hypothetical protein